ncbi:EAL domain-containing protein [Vibrio crassostreae]|nr:EAL domain-containing protein [Vibrio crassostreae]
MLLKDKITSSTIKYKRQIILKKNGQALGWEVLIDSRDLSSKLEKLARKEIIYNVKYNHSLLKRIIFNLVSSNYEREKLRKKMLFINCNIIDLYDSSFLDRLLAVNSILSAMQIELVIEITERKIELVDNWTLYIISTLKSLGLKFAADDYDISGGDFRFRLVKHGLFDFIKVECEGYDTKKLNGLVISSQGAKLIIERIETESQFNEISKCSSVYGLQGYYFGEEESVGI